MRSMRPNLAPSKSLVSRAFAQVSAHYATISGSVAALNMSIHDFASEACFCLSFLPVTLLLNCQQELSNSKYDRSRSWFWPIFPRFLAFHDLVPKNSARAEQFLIWSFAIYALTHVVLSSYLPVTLFRKAQKELSNPQYYRSRSML